MKKTFFIFLRLLFLSLLLISCQYKSETNVKREFVQGEEIENKDTLVKKQIEHCIEPEFIRQPAKRGTLISYSESSNIGILYSGFAYSLQRLLDSIKVKGRKIEPSQISQDLVNKIKLLIIPGGALSDKFPAKTYDKIKSYVNNGGTLLVFSQPNGASYSKLMDGVEAVGYEEDKTPNYMEVGIIGTHPMFNGFYKKSFVMAVDGHFKKYPETTKIYLKRIKLDQPILINYLLGKGNIIATTSFTPEAFHYEEATEDEIIFFREILNYLEFPMKLKKVKAGQKIEMKIKVKNEDTEMNATKAIVMVYDPEQAYERYREEFEINLKPGESTLIDLTYPTCITAMPGIWHTSYELMTEGYQLLTSEMEPEGVNLWLEFLLQPPKEAMDGRFIVTK